MKLAPCSRTAPCLIRTDGRKHQLEKALVMSETWKATNQSVRRLKAAWADADEDTRYSFAFLVVGLASMAFAIMAQFGWTGAMFCLGFLVWAAGNNALK